MKTIQWKINFGQGPYSKMLHSIELYAQRVMPRIRRIVGACARCFRSSSCRRGGFPMAEWKWFEYVSIPEEWSQHSFELTVGRYRDWVHPRLSDHVPLVLEIM